MSVDATKCVISLKNVSQPGGSITIKDTGCGMDEKAISASALVLRSFNKNVELISLQDEFQVGGTKRLGTTAALRMGNLRIEVVTLRIKL